MTRKQVSFRRDVNVVEESPSALSVASEGTADFLSISQTRMLLSMVDDNSVFSTSTGSGSGHETWSESELAIPVATSTSPSPSPSTGIDGNITSTGESLSYKPTDDGIHDYQNDANNDNESHETELDSHMDSGSDNEESTHRPPVPAVKVTPQESETTYETALDDSEHDDNQESLQMHGGPLQPTTVRQTPNKSIGSPRSRSRSTSNSQSTSLTSRNGDKEVSPDSSLHKNNHFPQVGAVQVPTEASAPNTPENKKQTPTNPHFSSQSTSVPATDAASRQVNQHDNPLVGASRSQPDRSRSAYETDPFASPVSTGSSDFHIRKLDSDIDSQLAEAMMDIAPSHGSNEGQSEKKDHKFPHPEEIKPKADDAEMSVMENSDEDSAISISSGEGLLDRASRRKSNRENFPDRQSYTSSRLSTRRNSTASKEKPNRWRVKVPTRRESIGSKSKTRKSIAQKSMPIHESVLSTERPKTDQLEIDDDSSVESPLPDATLSNEPSDNFFDDSNNEHPVETKQHEALDSDSDDDSPILLIKPRRTEQQPEKNVVGVKESNSIHESNAKVMLPTKTKQNETIDSDSDDDSPILLIKPRRTEQQPEKNVVGVKESNSIPESISKVVSPKKTKQYETIDSDSDDDSPILLIKPRRTEQQPEKNVVGVKESSLTRENNAKVVSPTKTKQYEAIDSVSDSRSPIQLVEPRRTERQPVVDDIKRTPENKTKTTTPPTNSVFASKKIDAASTEVKSRKASTISKAHDPPGFHGVIGPNDAVTKPKTSTSSEITKEPPVNSIKPQTPVKPTVKQDKTEKPAKKQSTTTAKKPKHKDGKELKSTKATSAVSQGTYDDTIIPLNDLTKKGPGKTVQTKKKAKAKESKPKGNVKSTKAKSLKVDPEPDKLPPYELSYQPTHQADGSPYQRHNSSMRSIDSDGIWRPPKNIPGLNGSANDLNSPDRSTSSLGSDDLNLTQVEWRSIKASIVKTERNNGATSQGSSRPQTPDISADRGKIGARNPATATRFSPVELNAITVSGNRSDASSSDYQGTPGASPKIGRFMKWPRGIRSEPTRRFSNESFEGANLPSLSTRDKVHNEDIELEKTPKAPKSKTFMWPTIPRLPSIDKNLSEVATDNHQETKTVEDTKKVQSPRIIAKSLPESYPSMQSPDRQIKEPAYSPLDVTTTPKKPKSSTWLPWARKSPKMKHTPVSAETKPNVASENPDSVKLLSRQGQRPLTSPPFVLSSNQRLPKGQESLSVAEQREARRVAYVMDRQRRHAIKIQAATRGYLSRKKFPRPRLKPKGTKMGTLHQTGEVIEPSQSVSPTIKSPGEAGEHGIRMSSLRNMKPALQGETSNAGKSVAEQREARRLAYHLDQQRRGSIVIQSALRGYLVRKKLGLHGPQSKKVNSLKPEDPPVSTDPKKTPSSFESIPNLRPKDHQRHLLVAPKTPEPITPKKGLRWLPWAKKRDGGTTLVLTDKNPQTSEFTNIQRFDASLYLRTRMYQDEQESQGKSLDEIREARRLMYLRDLERRDAIKIQSVARGFLLRRKLHPSITDPISKRQNKVKSADKSKSINSTTHAQRDSEKPIHARDPFDRSEYLRVRLQRDEAARKTKSVAEVRLERQQIYLRDLQRREATSIQAAWRGYQARKQYPGFTKTFAEKSKPVNQTTSTKNTATVKATKSKDEEDDENSKQSGSWMKRFFFGKSKEASSDKDLPVVDEQEPEDEPYDPYADTDDFFGFSDPKYKERTGFFVLDKPKRAHVEVPAVSEDARNWKGRKSQGPKVDFDKLAYLKERKAREEFEKQSAILARNNAARREAAQKDLERRGALRIQAVARGYIARKKNPLPKAKHSEALQNAIPLPKAKHSEALQNTRQQISQQRSKRLVTKDGRQPPSPSVARPSSKRTKKKGYGPEAQQVDRSTSSVVKNSQIGATTSEESTRPTAENTKPLRGSSTKALKKIPSNVASTFQKGQSTRSMTPLQQGEVNGEKDLMVGSDSEWSEEIIDEFTSESQEFRQGASTTLLSVAPKKLSTQGPNIVQQGSGEGVSRDNFVDSNGSTISQVGDFDQTENKNKAKIHSGLTYSTDVGDSWWLPSISTEDTRSYRQDIYVPDTDLNKYYRRPAPKNSTTTYWEAVRTSYLPSVIVGQAAPVIVPPTVPFSRTSSISSKLEDLCTTSSVHSEESWLPPARGEIGRRTIPHGNNDVGEEPEREGSWVPVPSKPHPTPKRVDFAGSVQKGESFRWAPHLPSPSKRENKPRIEQIISGDLGRDTLICDIQESKDIEQGTPTMTQTQMPRTSRTKNRRIMLCLLIFFVLLAGGGAAAYFLWEDPPWEKWMN